MSIKSRLLALRKDGLREVGRPTTTRCRQLSFGPQRPLPTVQLPFVHAGQCRWLNCRWLIGGARNSCWLTNASKPGCARDSERVKTTSRKIRLRPLSYPQPLGQKVGRRIWCRAGTTRSGVVPAIFECYILSHFCRPLNLAAGSDPVTYIAHTVSTSDVSASVVIISKIMRQSAGDSADRRIGG
ncbi:hypothetical protein SAMN02787142_2851 [Burkholderia sp. WP9]|nr:hypothetical protein SAMN02787142_2851 [Burkholderia sp. WP9]